MSPTSRASPGNPLGDRGRDLPRGGAWTLVLITLLASLGAGWMGGLVHEGRASALGDRPATAVVTWELIGGVPSPPRNLAATGGDQMVTLNWDPPADDGGLPVTGYNIYRGTTSGGESFLIAVLLVTTYIDLLVENGVTYYYYVTAVNLNGESAPSNEASATPGGAPPPTVPGPPKNLAATAGDGFVDLTWDAPDSDGGSPIKNYHIYRSESPDGETKYDTVGNVLSYRDSGVTNGHTYYYKVSAENDVGEGALSNEASATPKAPPVPPGPPLDLRATAGDGSVTLDWSPPMDDGGAPITNYVVYRGTTSGQLSLLATLPDVHTYQDTSVTNGVTYYYDVTAVNSAGEGPPSKEVSATPGKGATVPDPPANPVANGGDGRVSVSWQKPGNDGGQPITNYKLYRGTTSGGESWLATLAGDVLTYADTAVTNGVTYYYYVTAVNSIGESNPSTEVSATPSPSPTVPDAVQNLTAEPGDARIKLAWSPPAGDGGKPITNYKIYRGTSSGDRSNVTTLGNVGSFTDVGLSNGTRYYYVVTAVNEVGEGPPSPEVSATPSTVPGAPRQLRAYAGDGTVTIQWMGPDSNGGSPVTGYKIYRGTVSGGLSFLTQVGPIDSFVDDGRTNGQVYYYQVSAVNRAGEGPRSAQVSATPAPGTTFPGAPRSLIATAGNHSVRLDWSPPASDGGTPILNYTVYRSVGPNNLTRLASAGTALTLLDLWEVTNGVTYFYEVTASNAKGEGPRSPLASATPKPGPDMARPVVTITSPPPEETVPAGALSVYGTASDDIAVVRVELSSDGTTWSETLGTASWTGKLTMTEGRRTIQARVTDPSGNRGFAFLNVTVRPAGGASPAGGLGLGLSTPMMAAMAATAFSVSAGVAWLVLNRRKKTWAATGVGPEHARIHADGGHVENALPDEDPDARPQEIVSDRPPPP